MQFIAEYFLLLARDSKARQAYLGNSDDAAIASMKSFGLDDSQIAQVMVAREKQDEPQYTELTKSINSEITSAFNITPPPKFDVSAAIHKLPP